MNEEMGEALKRFWRLRPHGPRSMKILGILMVVGGPTIGVLICLCDFFGLIDLENRVTVLVLLGGFLVGMLGSKPLKRGFPWIDDLTRTDGREGEEGGSQDSWE